MPKAYDATTRPSIEMDPVAWLEYLGIPVPDPDPARVRVIDSNLATVAPEADSAEIGKIDDPDRLDVLLERVLDASRWDEVLALAASAAS
jgi:hypothetical protein